MLACMPQWYKAAPCAAVIRCDWKPEHPLKVRPLPGSGGGWYFSFSFLLFLLAILFQSLQSFIFVFNPDGLVSGEMDGAWFFGCWLFWQNYVHALRGETRIIVHLKSAILVETLFVSDPF